MEEEGGRAFGERRHCFHFAFTLDLFVKASWLFKDLILSLAFLVNERNINFSRMHGENKSSQEGIIVVR